MRPGCVRHCAYISDPTMARYSFESSSSGEPSFAVSKTVSIGVRTYGWFFSLNLSATCSRYFFLSKCDSGPAVTNDLHPDETFGCTVIAYFIVPVPSEIGIFRLVLVAARPNFGFLIGVL